MQPILQIENLNVQFDTDIQRINALNNVSLHVNKGEIVGIIGSSGSGKSTIAKTILGILSKNQSSQGVISFLNVSKEINLKSASREHWNSIRGGEATMVFQNPLLNLNPSQTIFRHFKYLLRGEQEVESHIGLALEKASLKEVQKEILAAYPHQLSGGQQQRVLIALAIVRQQNLLILDEPLSSLDQENIIAISSILKNLTTTGTSILLISHDLGVMELLADRIYVLNNGEVIEEDDTTQIIQSPQEVYTKALVDAKKLVSRAPHTTADDVIIQVDQVSHSYKQGGFLAFKKKMVAALSDVSLRIARGSITGLVGPSGSGKSTLVKVLLGQETLQSGNVVLLGKPLDNYQQKELIKTVQMIPQNTSDALNPRLTLEDQLRDVFHVHASKDADFHKVIHTLLKDVDLDPILLTRFPSELSGGEIQRMAIVRALIVRPEILILDESLSALDMLIQKRTLKLIQMLNSKLGTTIILISHDMRLIKSSCDAIFEFENGAVRSCELSVNS